MIEFQLDPFFAGHLQSFKEEIHDLRERLKASSTKLNGSRKQHLWVRLKWLSSDRELRKFYSKLDDWMKIFLTAVHTTELKLLTKLIEQNSSTHLLPLRTYHELQQTPSMGSSEQHLSSQIAVVHLGSAETSILRPNEVSLPPSLRSFLAQRVDLVGIRVQNWYWFKSQAWLADIRTGPTAVKTWSDNGKSSTNQCPGRKACASCPRSEHN
ncbi:hypothetical protein CC86DRAFT_373556 [Ophiobolus disseminans]|uniref:Uncharacterized protein n=1 Tax=Ophiobolus disseminans TaxID=1469910 RepID=A0A6A6ZLW9_9PLEO|nr:hypothetical protein CC86DRAFT_373556 [Ophiobolus disseminans]